MPGRRWGAGRRPRRTGRATRPRWGRWLAVAAVVVAVVAGASLWRDLSRARSRLAAARMTLQQAVAGAEGLRTAQGRAAVRERIGTAARLIEDARRQVTGSRVLSLTASVPGLRGQRTGLLQIVDDGKAATVAGDDLLASVERLSVDARASQGQIPFDELRRLDADVRATADRLRALSRSTSGLWGPVADARRRFDGVLEANVARLDRGADTLAALLGFLGGNGDRRHFIALQNNAEMRDQGMVLSYLVATFTEAGLTVEPGGSVNQLTLAEPVPGPLPEGTREVFGRLAPDRVWQSVNATADFAWTGRTITQMYAQATGQGLDGVIAVDVPALAALLRVVGPVTVPEVVGAIDAANVGDVLLRDFYEGVTSFADHEARRQRQADVAHAVVDRLVSGDHDVLALTEELATAAAGGHLRLWSDEPTEEEVLERAGLAGGPAVEGADRTFHLAVQNRTATKLDYYVKPSVLQEVSLTEEGDAVVRTTVTLDNRAPLRSPPSYALGPDGVSSATEPGDYVAEVLLWAPAGSRQPAGVAESGLVAGRHGVFVPGGAQARVIFEAVIPDAVRDDHFELRLVPQPRLEPVPLEVLLDPGKWDVDGALAWVGPWDRTVSLKWEARR